MEVLSCRSNCCFVFENSYHNYEDLYIFKNIFIYQMNANDFQMNPRKIHYCVTIADSILEDDKDGDTLIQSLYDNFRGLVQLAEPFKLAGGEDSDIGRKEMSGGNFMNKVDLISQELYENQGIPESSVEWDESSDEKEEGDISIVARAEGENSPEIQGGNAGNEHEAVSSPAERNNADIIDQD